MKVRVIARGHQEVFDWLDQECKVTGQKLVRFVEFKNDWHGDILPVTIRLGKPKKVYEVKLNDDCQSNLSECDFVFMPELKDNYEFVVPSSFISAIPIKI
jgi:hypothetical protein